VPNQRGELVQEGIQAFLLKRRAVWHDEVPVRGVKIVRQVFID